MLPVLRDCEAFRLPRLSRGGVLRLGPSDALGPPLAHGLRVSFVLRAAVEEAALYEDHCLDGFDDDFVLIPGANEIELPKLVRHVQRNKRGLYSFLRTLVLVGSRTSPFVRRTPRAEVRLRARV